MARLLRRAILTSVELSRLTSFHPNGSVGEPVYPQQRGSDMVHPTLPLGNDVCIKRLNGRH